MTQGLISLGWGLFVVSALFFVIAAWRAGDTIALVGAVSFMAANLAFIAAHLRQLRAR